MLTSFSNLSASTEMVQALPPEYQEKREIEAILEAIEKDPELHNIFGKKEISITKTETGYVVEEGGYRMEVEVRYLSPESTGFCGPVPFELIFGEVTRGF